MLEPDPHVTLHPGADAVASLRDLAEKMMAGAPATAQFGAIGAALTGLRADGTGAEAIAVNRRMQALTTDEQARVWKLTRTTSYGWQRALTEVEVEGVCRRNSAILPIHVANLNLPAPAVPKGRRLSRRKRHK